MEQLRSSRKRGHWLSIRFDSQIEPRNICAYVVVFQGTLTPLVGIGACVSTAFFTPQWPSSYRCVLYQLCVLRSNSQINKVSIQFGAFNYARRAFESSNSSKSQLSQLSYTQYYLAGAFAGVANSVISGPIEHVRIRLQTQPSGASRLYSGPIDCVRKLSAHEGVLAGVYRGEAVTILREAQAYGVWFLAFEYMMNADAKRNNTKRNEISQLKVAMYGGLAGEALWLGSYPFDVVKSKMQSDGFGAERRYKSMRDCFAQTYRAEGARGFWKGIGPTLLRAMPVSAGTFAV